MAEIKTKLKTNFTSYLGEEALVGSNAVHDDLKPKLLAGELEVANARNVLLYTTSGKSNNDDGSYGLLCVTNFKLSFLTAGNVKNESSVHQENTYLGQNDIALSNIDSIYQITERKRRLIGPSQKISSKIGALHIVCKNFRVLRFGFKRSEIGKGKHIAEALAKFAFPNQHNLLFSYNFKENYYNTLRNISMFDKKVDWNQELMRCGAIGWRVLSVERENNIPLETLPMHFVIPKSVTENEYTKLAECFRKSRTAIWVYGLENASLVRMAELIPTITNGKQENTMLELVRKCDPLMRQPHIMELSKVLPSIQDVYVSYVKLRELCTSDSTREFMFQDSRFYSLLDKSCWLLYVSLCLKYSSEAAANMRKGETVVLQECEGRDMCCVISSLTQILLDPFYRTIVGLQQLIQKEWVALGHPFSDRLGHVINNHTSEQSPLILLFLDCTWQLLQQFPEDFEFSETFLTTIWDSVFLPIFDTFQFNSERDRQHARINDHLVMRPVWDWGEQFSDKDIRLFSNPFYKKPVNEQQSRRTMMPVYGIPLPGMANNSRLTMNFSDPALTKFPERRFLEPQCAVRDLEIWVQCYYRWQPILEIKNGGFPQVDLYTRVILSSISMLQQALQSRDFDDLPTPTNEDGGGIGLLSVPSVSSFFPFSGDNTNSNELSNILTLSSDLLNDGSIFDGLSMSQGPD